MKHVQCLFFVFLVPGLISCTSSDGDVKSEKPPDANQISEFEWLSSEPLNNATEVSTETEIQLKFNENVDKNSILVNVQNANLVLYYNSNQLVVISAIVSEKTIVVKATNNLLPSTTYTLLLKNSIKDTRGVPLTLSSNTITFKTAAPVFNIEPLTDPVIGLGQTINLMATMNLPEQNFPIYLDGSNVVWSSSNNALATINSEGNVSAISEGEVTITGEYQSYKAFKKIIISGTFVERNVLVTGQGIRKYSLYTPKALVGTNTNKTVLSLHGGGGNSLIQAQTTLLNNVAEDQSFIVAYLNGTSLFQTYNAGACCGSAQTNNVDDVAYVNKVIDDLVDNNLAQSNNIFSSGFSNGGMMSYRLACEVAGRLSGIVAVGGGSGQYDFENNSYYNCQPTRPIPILHIHSTNDRNYPIAGGTGGGVSETNYYPITSTISDWIFRNNLKNVATEEKISENTICYHYRLVENLNLPHAPVTYCEHKPLDLYDPATEIVFAGGHSWPGGHRSPSPKSDTSTQEFSASNVLWKFLSTSGLGSLK